MFLALNLLFAKKRRFGEHINGRNQTNRTYYFYNDITDIKNFVAKLLKIDKKLYKTLIFTLLDTSQLKKLMIMRVLKA